MAAMLAELSLYASLAFGEMRRRWGRLRERLPLVMIGSAVLPYLIFGLPSGTFGWAQLGVLAALAALASFWFRVMPWYPALDISFLALMAGVYLAKPFHWIYQPPVPQLEIAVLGQLLWIRLGVLAVLEIRRFEGLGFGFIPSGREWLAGLKNFACFMPLGGALMYGLEFARLQPAEGWWWKAPVTFIGILWVVALAEEVFFRGMLQQYLVRWLGSAGGVALTALVFGAAHLPFRQFPNWEFAALAALAGVFYGVAFLEGRGVRAAMVTHALTVAAWRTLFQ